MHASFSSLPDNITTESSGFSQVPRTESLYPSACLPHLPLSLCVSMSAFRRERLQEERKRSVEDRRERLRNMLQEENAQLEEELRAFARDRSATLRQQERAEVLRSAREERRKKVIRPTCRSRAYSTPVKLLIVLFSL